MRVGPSPTLLKSAERPMIIVGQGALTRPDGDKVLHAARVLAETVGAISEYVERFQHFAYGSRTGWRP